MVIRIPENPRLVNASEESVWNALLGQLGDGDLVVAHQRVTDRLKDHEIDFVVALEGYGIVCLEVKGGQIWHDGTDWYQQQRKGPTVINPVRQARDASYALRSYVEADPRWSHGRLRWDHVVVIPNVEIADDFALPECPRWKVIDRSNLDEVVSRLQKVLPDQRLDRPALPADGVDQLTTVLSGQGLPHRHVVAGQSRTKTWPTHSPPSSR